VTDASGGGWVLVVPWLISAFGWIVVNRQNNEREKRKELRSRVDAVKKSIDELEVKAVDYHTVSASPEKSAAIKRLLSRVSLELQMLERLGIPTTSRTMRVIALRNSITLSNFDSETYAMVQSGDPLISAIGEAASNLTLGLEAGYSERYHREPMLTRVRRFGSR